MFAELLSELYLAPFFRAILISSGIAVAIVFLNKFNESREGERHIHRSKVPRWGGLAIIAGFWISIISDSNLVFSRPLEGMFFASLAVLFFGIRDDIKEINWLFQLVFQVILGGFVYFWGIRTEYISIPFGGTISLQNWVAGLFFVIGWLIISINSMNWLDGTDGLSGGVAFIGAVTIFLLALKPEVNQPPVGIIAAALAGSVLGFLIFNFHPGRIMAGTTGAMFFGFILGALAIFAGAKLATALLVMAIPIVDFAWVIGERIRSGVSIFKPDQRHLHHRLLKLGWSQTKIALFFYAITFVLSLLALNTRQTGKLTVIIFGLCLIIGIRITIDKKIKLSANENKIY